MKKYTVLTYNFNKYETFYEPAEVDPECEYIYVTDDETLKSNVWNIVVDHSLDGLQPFEKVFEVRYNLFKYATTLVCINVDGSVIIKKSLNKLYQDFENSGADLGINPHPYRWHLPSEYQVWCKYRDYPNDKANTWLHLMHFFGYDFENDKGQIQVTFRIARNTKLNADIDNRVLTLMKCMNINGYVERLDQPVYSFVVQHYFKNINPFVMSQQVIQSDYMTWTLHDPNKIVVHVPEPEKPLHLFGKLYNLYLLK